MSKSIEEVRAELDAKIPRDAIALRDGGTGKKLSYLEGWYVIDRLNKVVGIGNWAYGIQSLTKTFDGEVNGKFYASYLSQIRLVVKLPDGTTTEFTDVGFGDGQDARNPGKVHELASKESVTDGIKRCAKNLGQSMGLALYDKSQENVDDGEPEPVAKPAAQAAKPASRPKVVAPVEAPVSSGPVTEAFDRKALNDAIAAASAALINKYTGPAKQEQLKKLRDQMVSRYGTSKKEELTDQQAAELYQALNKGEVA